MHDIDIRLLKVAIVLALLLYSRFFIKHLFRYIRMHQIGGSARWRERWEEIIAVPVQVILWSVGLAYIVDLIAAKWGMPLIEGLFHLLRNGLVTLAVGWLVLRWKSVAIKFFGVHHPQTAPMLGKLLSIFIVILTLLCLLQTLGVNIVPLVAFGGVGAAALGFAAKDVIANFFGGLMLYITRPFSQGEEIQLTDRHVEGIVEEIGWYLTSLRDRDKRLIYLPNALFSNQLVVNLSRRSHRRFVERIPLHKEDFIKLEPLLAEMRAWISGYPQVDPAMPLFVALDSLKDGSAEIIVEVYTLPIGQSDFVEVKQGILLGIQRILTGHGAEIAASNLVMLYRRPRSEK